MSQRFKIVSTDSVTAPLEPEERVLNDVADVEALDAKSEEDLVGRIEDVDAFMMYHYLHITRKTIERLERCKLIVRCGVGVDNVDHEFAAKRGIAVSNVPDYGTEDVADQAMGMMLAMTRGFAYANSRLRNREGPWDYTQQAAPLYRLRDRVFGVLGLGRIGTAVALRAKAFGMDVVSYDPIIPDGHEKALGIRRVENPKALFEQAFVLSLHCPLTEETHHVVNMESMSWMPQGAYLVNTARGGLINTDDIPQAIETGQLAGAAIDVLDAEPPNDDDPLIVAWRDSDHPAHHRVLISPHTAFYSEEAFLDLRTKASEECRRAVLGEPLHNCVNGVQGK